MKQHNITRLHVIESKCTKLLIPYYRCLTPNWKQRYSTVFTHIVQSWKIAQERTDMLQVYRTLEKDLLIKTVESWEKLTTNSAASTIRLTTCIVDICWWLLLPGLLCACVTCCCRVLQQVVQQSLNKNQLWFWATCCEKAGLVNSV